MSLKKNAIMIADTRPALVGTLLVQLKETNPDLFQEAIIYYLDPIPIQDKEIMNTIIPCRFIKYEPPLPDELFQKTRFKRFSKLMFCRYEMFAYLDEFDSVTWIDTDVLIQGSLEEMIEVASVTGAAFIREDPVNKTAATPDKMRTCFYKDMDGYDMDEYLYCSGTIVVTRKIRDQYIAPWCYDKTIAWADNLELPDQGVLNAAIQRFGINVARLSGEKYCCYPGWKRNCGNATIIHSWGANKFWSDWYLYCQYPKWREYYEEWQKKGGSGMGEIAPSISIVMPVYKPDIDMLRECMASLFRQNRNSWERFSDFEVIIVSEPEKSEDVKAYVDSMLDPRVRLIVNDEKLGIAGSLNQGMKAAKGKYIARVDADDICADNRLFLQRTYLDEHPEVSACVSDFNYFGDMNETRRQFEGEMDRAWSVFTCPFDHPTVMLRKAFFIDNNLWYDESRKSVEDWELWLRAFDKGMKVGCINQVLYYHRWVNNSSAGQSNDTVKQMKLLVQKNFSKLDIEVPIEDCELVSPYNGRLLKEEDKEKAKTYLNKALENNKKLRVYEQESLKKAFDIRLNEIENGCLTEITGIIPQVIENCSTLVSKKSIKKVITRPIKAIFRPIYRILRVHVEDRIIEVDGKINYLQDQLNALNGRMNELCGVNGRIDSLSESLPLYYEKFELADSIDKKHATEGNVELNSEITSSINSAKSELGTEIIITRNQLSDLIDNEQKVINDYTHDIKRKLYFYDNVLRTALLSQKKAVVFCTPKHSNIGDAAITLGELLFIRKYYPDYLLIELNKYDFLDDYDTIRSMVNRDDLIFLQGGGNMGNKYVQEEQFRRRIVSDFKDNKIVIFPQTIYFDESDEGKEQLKISQDVYNSHENLLIFTRGQKSLDVASRFFSKEKSYIAPDMAMMIDWKEDIQRNGILLMLRGIEDENSMMQSDYEDIYRTVAYFDSEYDTSTNLVDDDPEALIDAEHRMDAVTTQLRKVASHQLVITNRLHGVIFSLITGTPCICIDSYNYKLPEYLEQFGSLGNVYRIGKDVKLLSETISKALSVEDDHKTIKMDEYYEAMVSKISG